MKLKKTKTTNWSDYNKKLEQRGSINLWIHEDLIKDLNDGKVQPPEGGNGRPFEFPDALIELLLMVRTVYKVPLRQTIGLAKDLFPAMGLNMEKVGIPHFSTLSRRARTLKVALDPIASKGPLNLALDSTGLKVYGEGEWKVRQHGIGKRRTWRKIHFAVDIDRFIVHAVVVSANDMHDSHGGTQLIDLVDGDIESVRGDGAYDTETMRKKIRERKAKPIIPPREDAKPHADNSDLKERDEAIQFIEDGVAKGMTLQEARKAWKQSAGYHKRSLVETHMYRFKNAFSDKLQSRRFENQATEVFLKTKLLNRMTVIGMPEIKKVA